MSERNVPTQRYYQEVIELKRLVRRCREIIHHVLLLPEVPGGARQVLLTEMLLARLVQDASVRVYWLKGRRQRFGVFDRCLED